MIPDSPSQLLKNAPITRARARFDGFDEMTPAAQLQAELLMQIEGRQGLSDVSFIEVLALTILLWKDCNHDRFCDSNEHGDVREVVRTAQIDQFLNTTVTSLSSLRAISGDSFDCEEPDGS